MEPRRDGPGTEGAPTDPEGDEPSSSTGEAGRRGSDVRSDCWVRVELAQEGDLQLRLTSKVEALFGADIRATVEATLRRCGIEHARVDIEDQGALPWVMEARVEAAVIRAVGAGGKGSEGVGAMVPPGPRERKDLPFPGGTERNRLRRSRLYLPGNEPKFMLNAGLHGPDAVILDLEDSVHPREKDAARYLVRNALTAVDFGDAERMVRINQLPLGLEDLDAIVPEAPDLVLVPKVETADEVQVVHARIEGIRRERRMESRVWIMPILESALGVENAHAIGTAADTVVALTIGLEDYTADLGVAKTPQGDESWWARSRLVNAARAAGLQAIDSVYGDVTDEEGLEAWGRRSRAMGFQGMGCIHPRQIRIIHRAFAPTAEEVEKALRIVEAFRQAEEKGLGVVSLGSKMIDQPVVLRARRLVERARKAGLLEEPGESSEEKNGGGEASA